MPIYEYLPSGKHKCEYCQQGFEQLEKMHDLPRTDCPQCGGPVQRVISAAKLGRSETSLETANLERHGFTQYRKSSKGVYQKTAGTGPDVISDD